MDVHKKAGAPHSKLLIDAVTIREKLLRTSGQAMSGLRHRRFGNGLIAVGALLGRWQEHL